MSWGQIAGLIGLFALIAVVFMPWGRKRRRGDAPGSDIWGRDANISSDAGEFGIRNDHHSGGGDGGHAHH